MHRAWIRRPPVSLFVMGDKNEIYFNTAYDAFVVLDYLLWNILCDYWNGICFLIELVLVDNGVLIFDRSHFWDFKWHPLSVAYSNS